jgi:hypothetical protein
MPYTSHIDASEETLRMLDEKFTPVQDDRFLYSLQQKKRDLEGLLTFNKRLELSYDYTHQEYTRLQELRKTYNQEYPTEHKKYFSTAVELMSKMRSTLSAFKKIVDEFHPKKKRGAKYKKDVSAYERTPLYNGPYSQDMFGWEAYPHKSVKDLFDNLNDYLELAKKCLRLCLEVIDEEKAIRNDPERAYDLYKDSFDRSVSGNRRLIDDMIKNNVFLGNDIVKAMEEAKDVKALIASLYHEFNHSDWNHFCACKTISDGRKVGLTDEESLLFGKDNTETVIRIRTLLDHILELAKQRDDVIGWEGMLDGCFVMHLLFWCGWNGTKNEALLNYITKRCEGKVRVVKMGAVMRQKRLLVAIDNADIRQQQDTFNAEINAFVDAILEKSSDDTH